MDHVANMGERQYVFMDFLLSACVLEFLFAWDNISLMYYISLSDLLFTAGKLRTSEDPIE